MDTHINHTKQGGFSIVELLVVLTLLLVALGAVFALFRDSIRLSTTTYEMTDVQESLRIAQEYISRDLMSAGDGTAGISNITLPDSFVTTYLTLKPIANSGAPGFDNLGILTSDYQVPGTTVVAGTNPVVNVLDKTDRITILERDPSFVPLSLPASAIVPSGGNVSVSPADINRFSVGEIYFLSTSAGATFGTVTNVSGETGSSPNIIFAASDTYSLNQPGNGGPIDTITARGTLPATLTRMRLVHYFIDSNKLLIRRVFGVGGLGFQDSVVAEHITNLKLRYGLDLRDANNKLLQPVREITTGQQQVAVSDVEVTLTAETVHAINTGARQQMTTTARTSVRNMQFRQSMRPGK